MKYQSFVFESYHFDQTQKTLTLNYSYDEKLYFKETFQFDFVFVDYTPKDLDKALQSLFFMAGVSYYKAYLAPSIIIKQGALNKASADFFATTYQQGLGEFFYVNKLDPRTKIVFPASELPPEPKKDSINNGLLVGIGGGKDSLVSIELLKTFPKVATWSLGHKSQLEPLINTIGLPHFWVERQWDRSLLELHQTDAYNGHIPISAIFACVGTIVAILTGYGDIIVSNENSANEPTLEYQGQPINHQYSKSLAFEKDFQTYLANQQLPVSYYSFLRPLSELYIAEIFAKIGFEKYKAVFSSCNRAFTHNQNHIFWDGTCPKCAFVFLALTPFIPKEQLEALFSGKNLLQDSALEATYKQLLGIAGDKPLDCVGEIKESRAAMRLAQKTYPELNKYIFDLPAEYNYQALAEHSMPTDVYYSLDNKLRGLGSLDNVFK
jgi:hypothetical protein